MRKLNIRYLRIDSLCVIQDSRADKVREIPRIGQVFKNAYLTSSAASAASVQAGFIYPRTPFHMEPIRLPFRKDHEEGVDTIFLYDIDDLPSDTDDPIEQRAWTLQERLLSQRVLVYGSTYLRWTCRSVPLRPGHFEPLQGTFLPSAGGSDFPSLYDINDIIERDSLYESWESLVMQFTRRSLTYASDSLRAVAGIAEQYGLALRDTCMARLRRNALFRGLDWSGILSFDTEDLPPTKSTYINPPWSWTSTSLQVSFESYSEILTNLEANIVQSQ